MIYVVKKHGKNTKTNESNTFSRLKALLTDIERRLVSMKKTAEINGDKDWEKSKLAILLVSTKNIILSIFVLRSKKEKTENAKFHKQLQIKALFRQLNISIILIKNEINAQSSLKKQTSVVIRNQKSLVSEVLRQMQLQHTI